MSELQVTILGSGSPLPDPLRAGPSSLVRAGGAAVLVDAGRGALMRMAQAGVQPPGLSALLLTHLHSDHTTDVNDVITMTWAMSMAPRTLPIVGPPGTARYIERTLAMLADDIGYRVAHHDDLTWEPQVAVTEVHEGEVDLGLDGLRIIAAATDHAPVHPTVGYRFEVGERSVVLAGDTVPCEGLDRLCAGADAYVQTVIFEPVIEALPVARLRDIIDYHSSVTQAADTARRAGVGTLVLNHMVPAPPPTEEGEAPWLEAARAGFDGNVVVARDLTEVVV